jgi:hypothetical protein
MRVIQILKIQNRKGNPRCEGGNTVVSSILPFLFVFTYKETSGWPEISRRQRGEERGNYVVACVGGVVP